MTTDEAHWLDDGDGATGAALVDVAADEEHAQSRLIDFERFGNSTDPAALLLDMIRHGVLALECDKAYLDFNSTVYAFDNNSPDWQALVDAIGWDTASEAIRARLAE